MQLVRVSPPRRRVAGAALAILVVIATGPAAAGPSAAQLAKDRVAAAEKVYALVLAGVDTGRATIETPYLWSVRWLDSAIAAEPRKAKRAFAEHVTRMTELEATIAKRVQAGTASTADGEAAAYFRIEAEHWQAKGKR